MTTPPPAVPISETRDRLFKKVREHMGWDDEKTALWFRTSNMLFGGCAPDVLLARRPEKAESLIESLIAGEGP